MNEAEAFDILDGQPEGTVFTVVPRDVDSRRVSTACGAYVKRGTHWIPLNGTGPVDGYSSGGVAPIMAFEHGGYFYWAFS